jgi:hypothetical protein
VWADLERFELTDLHIDLNTEGFAVWREMPSSEHRWAVDVIEAEFDVRKQDRNVKKCNKPNVFVDQSYATPPRMTRLPDFAIFGPDKLDADGDIISINRQEVNPHVIFQFSWKNSMAYEKGAVDDMMEFAGVGRYDGLGRPNVAYLIKARRKGSSKDAAVHGFDVYEGRQGQHTANDPSLMYRVDTMADVQIEVAPGDMGFTDNGPSLMIPLAAIRRTLEKFGVVFEREEAT